MSRESATRTSRRPKRDDAWGEAMRAAHAAKRHAGNAILERDDGFIQPVPMATYFSGPRTWPPFERAALRYARGRVLDVGCGAGRHALELQRRGLDVVAIDPSPKAIALCRARGVRDARVLSLSELRPRLGRFDTILLLGGNFGLLAARERAQPHLRRLAGIVADDGRIIATTLDPYATTDPAHLRYHRHNRARGRMAGQIRMRVRYRDLVDPWFDYLFVSKREMRELLKGSGWRIRRLLGPARPHYAAIIEREKAP